MKQLISRLRSDKLWFPIPFLIYSERGLSGGGLELLLHDFPGVGVAASLKELLGLVDPEKYAPPSKMVISPSRPVVHEAAVNDLTNPAFKFLLCRLNGRIGFVHRSALVVKKSGLPQGLHSSSHKESPEKTSKTDVRLPICVSRSSRSVLKAHQAQPLQGP